MPQFYFPLRLTICLILLPFLAVYHSTQAQSKRANSWYFTHKAGINFNQKPPAPAFGGQVQSTFIGSATISDDNGNLLFYTDGHSVWNKNHIQMSNGFGLTKGAMSSYIQTSVIVPKPGSSTIYYIFTTNQAGLNVEHGLFYAVVDLSLQNGLGEVTQKNILLQQHMNLGLTAVQHANGNDYWVIGHPWGSTNYLSYQITSEGVNAIPVVSAVNQTWWGGWYGGQSKASPDGAWVATVVQKGIELAKFSTLSGKVHSPIFIKDEQVHYNSFRGVEFSSNSNVFYAASLYEGFFQYDVTQETPADILKSLKKIGDPGRNTSEDLQLAPDGNIYVGKGGGQWDGLLTIGFISKANSLETIGKYNQDAMHMQGLVIGTRLPTFITSFLAAPASISYSNICLGDVTTFSAGGIGSRDSVRWFFSDAASGSSNTSTTFNAGHKFTAPGMYNVSLRVYLGGSYKELTQQLTIIEKPIVNLGPDVKACSNETVVLDAGEGVSYLWSTGETTRKIKVTISDSYWVDISNGFCSSRDTIKVDITQLPVLDLGPDQQLCSTTPMTLSVGSKNEFYKIKWSTGETTPSITVQKSGLYWAEVTKEECMVRDEIQISYNGLTDLAINPSTTSPKYDEIITLEAAGQGLTSFNWNFGDGTTYNATNPSHLYKVAGTYPVTLKANNAFGCTATATILVTVAPYIFIPNIFTPNGDGKNDVFEITYNAKGPFDIKIYDRWGKQVYQARDKNFQWAATGFSDGVYFYIISTETGIYKGAVEKVR